MDIKKISIILILLFLSTQTRAEEFKEGDFWRDKKKEAQGYKVIEQNFSHIIYKDLFGQKWTRCHSDMKWIPLEKAHKIIIDNRENTRERLEWEFKQRKLSKWLKFLQVLRKKFVVKPPLIIMIGDRILDYEELYYCTDCYCRFTKCK